MAKKNDKPNYYVSPVTKDCNGCWCCSAMFMRADGRPYRITCCGLGSKAPQAKKDAVARLEERCAEYLEENPTARRLTVEEVEAMR